MKANEFKAIYNTAKDVDIKHNHFFNYAGWFWLGLTDKQYEKMWELVREQNHLCKGTKHITLASGIQLINPSLKVIE